MSVVDDIIRREGDQYTNIPGDAGGPTKYGITLKALAKWRGHDVLPWDVEHMQETEARDIYRAEYVAPWSFISAPRLRDLLADMAVNHGLGKAKELLQMALGVTPDGDIGPTTIRAIGGIDSETLRSRVIAERMKFYGRIVHHDPTQAEFIEGWLNRCAEFLYA